MFKKITSIGNKSLVCLVSTLLVFSFVSTSSMHLSNISYAQNTTDPTGTSAGNNMTSQNIYDTFRAKGQISSLASDIIAGKTNSSDATVWVLGGNWILNVMDGNLTNFNTDIKMTKIDGTGAHYHSIENIRDASGNYTIGSDKKIVLEGNSTGVSGIADITTNGNVKWKDVPLTFTILNGNILNLVIDPVKTDNHFKGLPIYGTVNSIVNETGKELLVIYFVQ